MTALVLCLSVLDSVGFCQQFHEPAHCFNYSLGLALTYGIETVLLLVKNYPNFTQKMNRSMVQFDVDHIVSLDQILVFWSMEPFVHPILVWTKLKSQTVLI